MGTPSRRKGIDVTAAQFSSPDGDLNLLCKQFAEHDLQPPWVLHCLPDRAAGVAVLTRLACACRSSAHSQSKAWRERNGIVSMSGKLSRVCFR